MPFRHEIKHEINQQDLLVLRSRLDAVMTRDSHACGEILRRYLDEGIEIDRFIRTYDLQTGRTLR